MAMYTVTHSCGHSTSQQLYGLTRERNSRLDWLRSQPCPECKRRGQFEVSAAYTRAEVLPALVGTPKQVAWAVGIRAAGLAAVAETLAQAEAKVAEWTPEESTARDDLRGLLTALKAETSAAWWIDHRGESGRTLLSAKER